MQLRSLGWLILTLMPVSVDAKELYVNATTGNDATSYAANSPNTPWKTIGRAAWGSPDRATPNKNEAAKAGDVVIIAAGKYVTTGRNGRFDVAYNPVNSGAPGSPIVFRAEGTVELVYSSGSGPVIGAQGRHHITWQGPFTIDEAQAPSRPDTGPVVFSGSTHTVLDGVRIVGDPKNFPPDNHAGVYTFESSDAVIRNCRISGIKGNHHATNAAGVITYRTGRLTIENNEFSDSGAGVNLKAPDYGNEPEFLDWFIVRRNIIHHVAVGIQIHNTGPLTANNPVKVYQNIIHSGVDRWGPAPASSGIGIMWRAFNSDPQIDARFGWAVNNVIVNVPRCMFMNGNPMTNAGHRAWNNICSNTTEWGMIFGGASSMLTPTNFSLEHNVYHSTGGGMMTNEDAHSLSQWKSNFRQDSAAPASITSDPRFVNPGGGDYRLRPDSPARALGVDVLDLNGNGSTTDVIPAGVYVTGSEVIGPPAKGGS
jgi:hypothetical protein